MLIIPRVYCSRFRIIRTPLARIIKFSQANEVLRRGIGYHTCPLGADVAAAVRIPFPAHRHSVVDAHGLVVAERDNKKEFEP